MPLLEIKNLRKSYRAAEGGTHAVVDIPAFTLDAKTQVALSGESGSGKTTFLNLIAGIVTPDAGEIRLDGQTVSSMPESQRDRLRATTIGYIFQTFNLLQGFSCVENVLLGMSFGSGVRHDHAMELLDRVGLAAKAKSLPRELSVGQQQRVAVARALANKPKLVLADEPTGNLDPTNAQQALKLIRESCAEEGAALLLVSHDRAILEAFENHQSLGEINLAGKEVAA